MLTIISKDRTPLACHTAGSGEPLLLIHGTAGDHSAWLQVAPALTERFRVFMPDRRGRGDSGDGPDYTLAREAEDITAIIEAIGAPVYVLGHSFGGLCALEAALLSESIAKLVLYEPPLSLVGSGWSEAMEQQMQSLLDVGDNEAALLLFFRDIVKASEAELAALQGGTNWPARVASAPSVLRELQAISRYRFDAERFRHMRTPTLLLLGTASPPRRHRIADTLLRGLPASRLAPLAGQQHGAMRSAPALFVETVSAFIDA